MSLPGFSVLLADQNATFWFPPRASTFAEETDVFFMYILYLSLFFFVLIVGAMGWFMIKYRRRDGYEGDSRALHNNALEITWTVIPTLLVCWIFVRGVYGYMDMMTPPPDTLDINVSAIQWDWSFQYPNGAISPELHIPNEQAIRLRMRSADVLHAFYVPAFRAKTDIVPGRVNIMWFKPILEGEYDLFCAEYCGDQHSEMIKRKGVVVHSREGYEQWVAEAAKPPVHPVAHGYWLYERMGCKSCHSVEVGKRIVGPSFAESYGSTFQNAQGKQVTFDEQYVQESLLNPQAQMKPEFVSASQMPSFLGKLKEAEIISLIAFLKAMTEDDFIQAVADGNLTEDEKRTLGIADETEESADGEAGAGEAGDAQTPNP